MDINNVRKEGSLLAHGVGTVRRSREGRVAGAEAAGHIASAVWNRLDADA